MIFVVDSNILISALIRDSTTRKILIESEWSFYYPEISFHEVGKYKSMILEKSKMAELEYSEIVSRLMKLFLSLMGGGSLMSILYLRRNYLGEK